MVPQRNYPLPSWSFSSLKAFSNCQFRYNQTTRLKAFKEDYSAAQAVGHKQHGSLEAAVKQGIPTKDPILDMVVATCKREFTAVLAEHKFAFSSDFKTTSWFDKSTWFRYAPDIMGFNGATGHLIDLKTGKSAYADTTQLALGAVCMFTVYPEITTVKGALLFTKDKKFMQDTYTRDRAGEYLAPFMRTYTTLLTAIETNTWSMNPTGLCKTCPVSVCPHYKGA